MSSLSLVECPEAVDHLSRPRSPLAGDRHPTVVDERVDIRSGKGASFWTNFGSSPAAAAYCLRGEERFHLQGLRKPISKAA